MIQLVQKLIVQQHITNPSQKCQKYIQNRNGEKNRYEKKNYLKIN